MKNFFGKQAVGIVMAMIMMLLFIVPAASGEQSAWDCPECGRTGNLWNYCGNCAHPAPWTTSPAPAAASSSGSSASGAVINELGDIGSLNVGDRANGAVYHFTFQTSAAEKPANVSGHGYLYTNSDNSNYGFQIVYTNSGIFTRSLNNGSYGAWADNAAPAATAAPAASSIIELGTIKSIDISDRAKGTVYHFIFESGEGSPTGGSGQGFLFVNSDNQNYGRQVFFSDRGIYTRKLNNGKYMSWKTLVN